MSLLALMAGTICAFNTSGHGHGLAATLTLMTLGLVCAVVAATLTIRHLVIDQSRMQHDAFRLGEEASRLRRVGG